VTKKDDKYVMYYAKQSLVVFISAIVLMIVGWIFLFIPIIGWVIYWLIELGIFVLWVISWIYALSGEMKPTPVIGNFADKINL
jgi:uncharacterized membrane protein